MQPNKLLAEIETREKSKLRIHSAVGLAVLTVYGGLMSFALLVMSNSTTPQQYGVDTVQAAATDATNSLTLNWTAPGDDGNVGQATAYDIRYSTSPITEATWGYATAVPINPTPKTAGSAESLLVTSLQPNSAYYFALKSVDNASNWSALSNIATKTTTAISLPNCVENWNCNAWSACTGSQQTRNCTDQTACGSTSNRPALTRSCTLNPDGTTTLPNGQPASTNDIPPNTAITSAPTAPLLSSRIGFTWRGLDDATAPDALTFSTRLDGGAWSGWSTQTQIIARDLANGSHTLEVRSRDASGNIDPTPAATTFTVALKPKVVVSQETGSAQVSVLNASGKTLVTFQAFEKTFKGGVQVQVGDLGDNGMNEIVAVPGPGRVGEVRIFRMDGTRIASYQPFGAKYKDGLTLALGNVDGTGPARVIVAKQKGSAIVRTFGYIKGRNTQVYAEFIAATSNARAGISLASGDVNGDGKAEIITAPYGSASATVSAYSLSGKRFGLLAQAKGVFTGNTGLSITTGDLGKDGKAEVLVGMRTGNTTIKVLKPVGKKLVVQKPVLVPFAIGDRNGVRVSTGDLNNDGRADILVAHGAKVLPQLVVFSGATFKKISTLATYSKTTRAVLTSDTGY